MSGQQFGGIWTEKKLEALRKYLKGYTTALKNQPFDCIYIDAFAGTGHRAPRRDNDQAPLFPEFDQFAKGSARIALEIEPSFAKYIFVESNRSHFAALKKLENDFPDKADRMRFIKDDANQAIVRLCEKEIDWNENRAVLFVDPYGLQVSWSTIEAVARTESIDLWWLVPIGEAIIRMLPGHGNIDPKWEAKLDDYFGDSGWREFFYSVERHADLFEGTKEGIKRTANYADIERYLRDRLKTIFPRVADRFLTLRNSIGTPLYVLCFAVGNPTKRAQMLAFRLAKSSLLAS